jgi:hypothetical protein
VLEKADARLPSDDEMIPKPKPHKCVVFRDQFAAGLRIPCQDFIEEILKAYNIEIHHLTPNEIANIAFFIWVVKSQRGNLDIGAFCSLHEMHTQFRNKNVDGRSILVAVVSSLLEVPNRFLQLQRTSGLKIGIVIGFIIQFLLSKKGMTLEGL